MRFFLHLMAIIPILAGCSAKITTSEILEKDLPKSESVSVDGKTADGIPVDGIPFRISKRYKVDLYQKISNEYKKLDIKPTSTNPTSIITLADPDRLFLLNFKGQAFSTGKVDLALNPDNTIKTISLTSASNLDEAITTTGSQLKAVSDAIDAQHKKEKTESKDKKEEVTSQANLAIAAEAAKQQADLAELQLANKQGDPSATAEDVLKASQYARLAKIKANEASRLAGLAPFYPGVIPGIYP